MPTILAVATSPAHGFSKPPAPVIHLVAGRGVAGDAHEGTTVQHRSRVARDPTQPNLRQVHLVHAELLADLAAQGFTVAPGDIGENVLTRGLDLLALGQGTRLHLGPTAIVEVMGLRNPCAQLDRLQPGLMAATLGRAPDGTLIRKAGIMAIVLQGGPVHPGDAITVATPPGPPPPAARVRQPRPYPRAYPPPFRSCLCPTTRSTPPPNARPRSRARAKAMWESEGSPEGRMDDYRERADELVRMEMAGIPAQVEVDPNDPMPGVIVEEASIQENLGEFPGARGVADQGEWRETPMTRKQLDEGGDPQPGRGDAP